MKSLINKALLIEQLKRFWVIGVVPMVIYLLSVVIPLHNAASNTWNSSAQSQFMLNILTMSHPAIIIGMILVPLGVAMALYPYNFSPTATSTFYTFPITKRQLFWTNFAAGAILMLLPLLVLSLILLVPIYFEPGHSYSYWDSVRTPWRRVTLPALLFPNDLAQGAVMNSFGQIVGFFARAAIGFMFYFGLFLLAVSVAGNRVVSVLLCGALPFIPVAIHTVLWGAASLHVFGASDAYVSSSLSDTLMLTNPVSWVIAIQGYGRIMGMTPMLIFQGDSGSLLLYYIVYIVIGIALFTTAYICSRKRKHERTGDSVVFTALKNALVFILAMAGMIVVGIFGALMFQGRFGMYLGAAVGFVLLYFIGQMIAEKSFNVIGQKAKSLLYFGGTMVGIYVAILIITTFGMGFYVNRVPNMAEVDGVYFSHQRNHATVITEPEVIALTMELHNAIINNRGYLRRAFWQTMRTNTRHTTVLINYRLNNGNHVRRRYTVTQNFREQHGIDYLLSRPEVLLRDFPALMRPEVIGSITMNFEVYHLEYGWGGVHSNTFSDRQQVLSLAEAILADFVLQNSPHGGWEPDESMQWFGFNINVLPQYRQRYGTSWVSIQPIRDGNVQRWMDEHWDYEDVYE